VITWMKENLHFRALGSRIDRFETLETLQKAKDPKETQRILIAILQLHEYWTLDHVPDGQDATMETLEQYEQRVGLTAKDRGMMPSFGYSGAIPLDAKVIRPTLLILGEEVQAELPNIVVSENEITATVPATIDQAAIAEVAHRMNAETLREMEADRAAKDKIVAAQIARASEELPKILAELHGTEPVYELIDEVQTDVELRQRLKDALGRGPNTLRIKIGGNTMTVTGKKLDHVPEEFLKQVTLA